MNYVVTKDDVNTTGDMMNGAIFIHLSTPPFIIDHIKSIIYHIANYGLSSPTEFWEVQKFVCHHHVFKIGFDVIFIQIQLKMQSVIFSWTNTYHYKNDISIFNSHIPSRSFPLWRTAFGQ